MVEKSLSTAARLSIHRDMIIPPVIDEMNRIKVIDFFESSDSLLIPISEITE
jgi:hypothetical protein